MTDAIIAVLRTLIDAAFSSGGITDLVHTELHGKLDAAAEPAPAPETDEAPTTAPPAESNPYA